MDDIEEWSGCSYIQLKEIHKTGNSGEERQLSGHLQSPTVIDDGRLVSE